MINEKKLTAKKPLSTKNGFFMSRLCAPAGLGS
jgi:hypothetical protein